MKRNISSIDFADGIMTVNFEGTAGPEIWNLTYAVLPIGASIGPDPGPEVMLGERSINVVTCVFSNGGQFVCDPRDVNGGADYATCQDLIDAIIDGMPA